MYIHVISGCLEALITTFCQLHLEYPMYYAYAKLPHPFYGSHMFYDLLKTYNKGIHLTQCKSIGRFLDLQSGS